MDESVAAVEPFPLVPPTSTEGTLRSGRSSLSQRASIAASPSFIPRSSRDSSRAREGNRSVKKGPPASRGRRSRRRPQELQAPHQRLLHLHPVHDEIEHAVLEQELGALEPLG